MDEFGDEALEYCRLIGTPAISRFYDCLPGWDYQTSSGVFPFELKSIFFAPSDVLLPILSKFKFFPVSLWLVAAVAPLFPFFADTDLPLAADFYAEGSRI